MEAERNMAIVIFGKVFATYSLVLIVAGSILNPLTCFIILRSKQLRTTSTFKLVAIVAVTDMVSLFQWNQESFTNTFFNLLPYFRSLVYCHMSIFLQYTTLELSSWLWVSISADRFLSLYIKRWSKDYFTGYRPLIYSAILLIIFICINFNVFWTNGYSFTNSNGTEVIVCYAMPFYNYTWYTIMSQVGFF